VDDVTTAGAESQWLAQAAPTVFAHTISQTTSAVLITDASFDGDGPRIVYANPAFCRMSGYRMEQLIGRSPRLLQGPRSDRALLASLREHLLQGLPFTGSTVNYTADGRPYTVEWSISPVRNAEGVIEHFVSVQSDISARIAAEQERRLLLQALDAAADPILITGRDTGVVFVNEAFARLTGYAAEEILGQSAHMLYPSHQDPMFQRNLRASLRQRQPFRATFIYRHKSGRPVHVEQSIAPVVNAAGRISHYISTGKDVSERVERESRLLEMATIDSLTGLYNRHAGSGLMRRLVDEARRSGHALSVILADIDYFKAINDTYGHKAGDDALARVGQVLKASVRADDVAVRWGGEEFLVVLPHCDLSQALELGERLRAAVGATQVSEHAAFSLSISAGVAQMAAQDTVSELLRRADLAMYRAKRIGRNSVVG
jgi:diguanylate cyclase (GGDEF)-like protein/PAS domain S-box-containing protein